MSVAFSVLKGQIFSRVYQCGESIVFEQNGKIKYTLEHMQDCCETVYIEDICGDLESLENTEIFYAEESSSEGCGDESSTWTFFKLGTIKGWVDIRFYGTSNGYYSESAGLYESPDFQEEEKKKKRQTSIMYRTQFYILSRLSETR